MIQGERRARRLSRRLLAANLATVRSCLLNEDLAHFWTYKSMSHAARHLDDWIRAAVRSRIAPMVNLVYTLLDHGELLLNWFQPRGELAMGAAEGTNGKARVTTKLAYGFRSYDDAETALFHRPGNLPEPIGAPTDSCDEADFGEKAKKQRPDRFWRD